MITYNRRESWWEGGLYLEVVGKQLHKNDKEKAGGKEVGCI